MVAARADLLQCKCPNNELIWGSGAESVRADNSVLIVQPKDDAFNLNLQLSSPKTVGAVFIDLTLKMTKTL